MICRIILSIALILICLFSQLSAPATDVDTHIYRIGTKFIVNVRWWVLSAAGTMEVLGNTKFRGNDVILVRSQVEEVGGFLGFIVRFLRIYKESNTFDSYIDTDTFMPVRYEVYKLRDDGSRKITEHVHFDRDLDRVMSLGDNRTIINNVAPDIRDIFSTFLALLHRLNTEEVFVGKKIEVNIYAYKKASRIEIETIHETMTDGRTVYTLEMEEIPELFKYPASISFEVTDVGGGFRFPTRAKCTISLPALPDITIHARLREERAAG